MKSILTELFPYIVILYLADCITYVKNYHILLVSHFGRDFQIKNTGLHIFGILPTSQSFLLHKLPIFPAGDGLYILKDHQNYERPAYEASDFYFVRYTDLNTIEAKGKTVKICEELELNTPSPLAAVHIATFLNDLRMLYPAERLDRIHAFSAETGNLAEVKGLVGRYSTLLFYLKLLGCVLFVLIFVFLPMLLYSNHYSNTRLVLLSLYMGLSYLVILILFHLLHKRIYGNESGHVYAMLAMFFSPVTAIHALNALTRDLYSRYDHLTVAMEFLPSKVSRDLVRREITQINYAKHQNPNSTFFESLKLREEAIRNLLSTAGLSIHDVLTSQKKQDDSAGCYCPVCGVEFRPGFNRCSDCGVPLTKYE